MSTATAVDHFADAIRGALATRPTHAAQALASDASDPWVSSEWPRPFHAPHAGPQTPGRTAQPVIPTHNPRTSHPATSTTLALTGQGSR